MTNPVDNRQMVNYVPGNNSIFPNETPDDILCCILSALIKLKNIHPVLLTNRKLNDLFTNYPPLLNQIIPIYFPNSFKDNPKTLNVYHPGFQGKFKKLKNIDKNIKASKFRIKNLSNSNDAHPWVSLQKQKLIPPCSIGRAGVLHKDKFYYVDSGCIRICDANSDQELSHFGAWDSFTNIAVQGDTLITCSPNGELKFWDLHDLKDGKELKTVKPPQPPIAITSMTLDDDTVYYGGDRWTDDGNGPFGEVYKFELNSKADSPLVSFWKSGNPDCVHCLAAQDGILCAGSIDSAVTVWDSKTGEELRRLLASNNANNDVDTGACWDTFRTVLLHDGKLFAGNNYDGIVVWDIHSGKKLSSFKLCEESLKCLGMRNGKLYSLLTNGWNDSLKVWDFNFEPLTPYSQQVLEDSLSILGKMAHAEHTQSYDEVEALAKTLPPDFQKRLKLYAYTFCATFKLNKDTLTKELILHVQEEVVLELLLNRICNEDQKRVSELLNQLVWIDEESRRVYEYLWNICGKQDGEGKNWGECAFHGDSDFPTTIQQKEEAVLQFKQYFFSDLWGRDLPHLLVDLGVVFDEEYSQKLGCTPDVLEKVGIVSQEDLDALGIITAPVAASIDILKEQPAEDQQAVQRQHYERREQVCDALQKVSEEIQKRIRESENCGVPFFADEKGSPIGQELNPWAVFKKQFEESRALIEGKCQTPSELSKNYAQIVTEANDLIEKFNTFDQEYQILKLRTYIRQEGIRPQWSALNEQEIHSLAEFARNNPNINLFQMGV